MYVGRAIALFTCPCGANVLLHPRATLLDGLLLIVCFLLELLSNLLHLVQVDNLGSFGLYLVPLYRPL